MPQLLPVSVTHCLAQNLFPLTLNLIVYESTSRPKYAILNAISFNTPMALFLSIFYIAYWKLFFASLLFFDCIWYLCLTLHLLSIHAFLTAMTKFSFSPSSLHFISQHSSMIMQTHWSVEGFFPMNLLIKCFRFLPQKSFTRLFGIFKHLNTSSS